MWQAGTSHPTNKAPFPTAMRPRDEQKSSGARACRSAEVDEVNEERTPVFYHE
jgi:hypothetical protein